MTTLYLAAMDAMYQVRSPPLCIGHCLAASPIRAKREPSIVGISALPPHWHTGRLPLHARDMLLRFFATSCCKSACPVPRTMLCRGSCGWQLCSVSMHALGFVTARCAAQISPTTLFLVEGGGQLPYAMCWGDGFVTNSSIIAANNLSDPNPFFQTLLTKPYLSNVVISPHYYPPSISFSTGG